MQRVGLLDSIFTRLVAWAIAVSIVVVLVLGALVSAKFQQMTDATVRYNVDSDIAHLAEILEARGMRELVFHIEESLQVNGPVGSEAHYLLLDESGNRLAGDMGVFPQFAGEDQAGMVTLPSGRPAYARAVRLGPDLRLVAMRETGWATLQLNQIGLAFVGGGLFVVLAVAVAGYITARRLSRRVKVINAAFRDPEPERLAALGTGQNEMDEIGELTRHSSAALDRLAQLMGSHRDTADQIAHEMRTPLMHLDNRLVRAIQAQETARIPDPETTERLVEARSEIRHVVATLESLLDIAHSEAQRGDIQGLTEIDMSSLAANIADLYQASAEDTGHDFVLDVDDGVTMQGDEIQLTRLITNLLDNAFKYVPAGGKVTLSVKQGPLIAVTDNGPGIEPQFHETIFQRFGRGGETTGIKGAGLGLALARAIAQRHGLELRLAPTYRGARFEIRPIPEEQRGPAGQCCAPASA